MTGSIIYIAGIFEDETSSLFLDIKDLSRQLEISCKFIGLYSGRPFGSYSFPREVRRIDKIIVENQPQIIVAHSLGGYIAMHIPVSCPLICLDPSLSITDIILPNTKHGTYNDGTYTFQASKTFLDSIEESDSIEVLTRNIQNKASHIDILGAGRGGYKIAKQYHQNLVGSSYFLLSEANHEFSDQISRQKILGILKKRLDTRQSSRS